MILSDLIIRNRSYRRFDGTYEISVETLKELIDLARLSPSGKNMQALRYVLSVGKERNDKIFPCLTWAAYLRDWNGPEPHERSTAYIVVTMDTQLTDYIFCDDGIAMQSILLGAVEKGLGGCIIGAVHKEKLREVLCLPEHYRILYVMALGKPVETVVIEEMQNNDIRYWRDEDRVHHVPKRRLEDLIIQPE